MGQTGGSESQLYSLLVAGPRTSFMLSLLQFLHLYQWSPAFRHWGPVPWKTIIIHGWGEEDGFGMILIFS